MTAERRALVRARVGDDVERLVARYTEFPWSTAASPSLLAERFEPRDGLGRTVFLLRPANELDEHVDLNALHCRDAERRQRETGSTLRPCIGLAERLGAVDLAAELERAFAETVTGRVAAPPVEASSRSFVQPPLSHVPRLKVRLGPPPVGAPRLIPGARRDRRPFPQKCRARLR